VESDAVHVPILDVLPAEIVGDSVDVLVTIPGGSSYEIVIPAMVSANLVYGATVTNTVYVYHVSGDTSASVVFQVVAWMRVYLALIQRTL